MDDKKPPRFGGSKVSEIANIFQSKEPNNQKDELFTPFKKLHKVHHTSTEKIDESPAVTIMRTESHVTRFNNARAMFEKLGEETKKERIIPLQSTKSASSILESRSRSSSANSETRDTKSHDGSRSPSPGDRKNLDKYSTSVPVLNNVEKSNGIKGNGIAKTNGVGNIEIKSTEERIKPQLMKKPEKPERKFNSKELIERQRNWTSHFSKTRTNRYSSDPNKNEDKLTMNIEYKEGKISTSATRSASFSTRLKSPPMSPPPPPLRTDASRRTNFVRKERPASVIPTIGDLNTTNETRTPLQSPPATDRINSDNERLSFMLNCSNNDVKATVSTADEKSKNKCVSSTRDISPKRLFRDRSPEADNSENLLSTTQNLISKSPLEDKHASKENLSGTSGSLSSLSPPSSPSKMKSEQEKQEQEGNEKSILGRFTHYLILLIQISCNNRFGYENYLVLDRNRKILLIL